MWKQYWPKQSNNDGFEGNREEPNGGNWNGKKLFSQTIILLFLAFWHYFINRELGKKLFSVLMSVLNNYKGKWWNNYYQNELPHSVPVLLHSTIQFKLWQEISHRDVNSMNAAASWINRLDRFFTLSKRLSVLGLIKELLIDFNPYNSLLLS